MVDAGWQLHQAGRLSEAESLYRQVLASNPNQPDAIAYMGLLAAQTGKLALAAELIGRAIQIDPNQPHYHSNLGQVLANSNQLDAALVAFDRALALHPTFTTAMVNRGIALLLRDQFESAIESFDRALSIDPSLGDAHNNRAVALHALKRLDEAADGYRHAIQCRSDDANAHLNLGLILLLQGKFDTGWKEFEWRWRTPRRLEMLQRLNKPAWRGDDIAGKVLLIHADEGFGDTLQFVRFLPLVAKQSRARIVLQCQHELARLLESAPGVERVVDVVRVGDFEFDFHCPLLSLPGLLHSDLSSIAKQPAPYIRADRDLSSRWKTRIESTGDSLRAGIAWAGRPEHANDRNRSLPLEALAPLAQVPGLHLVSLQKGISAEELQRAKRAGLNPSDWTADLTDFAETAALIDQLDLVIAVDTAVAHLAGAMGKRVYLMLPFVPDWRWLLDRTDSPWYPSMTLFRQPSRGDWDSVVKAVVKQLMFLRGRDA